MQVAAAEIGIADGPWQGMSVRRRPGWVAAAGRVEALALEPRPLDRRPLRLPQLEANLLVLAPLFLSPSLGSGADVLRVAVLLAVTSLLSGAAALGFDGTPGLRARPWYLAVPATLAAGGALWVGAATMPMLLALLGLEICRRFWQPRLAWAGVTLACLAAVTRIDLGATALGTATSPLLMAGAAALTAWLMTTRAGWSAAQLREAFMLGASRRAQLQQLAGLLLFALTLALQVALLMSDVWIQSAGGALSLLSVAPLAMGMLRWRRLRQVQGAAAGLNDLWLAGCAVAWGLLLSLTLPLPQGF